MAGFENDVMVAKNLNFDETAAKPHLGIIDAAGKLPIGTGNSFPTPEILAGSLTSPNASITIGYSSPNITLQVAGGTTSVIKLTGNSGVATPSAGNINVITANTTVKFVGSGSTLTQDFAAHTLAVDFLLLGTNLVGTAIGLANVGLGRLSMGASVTNVSNNTAIGNATLGSVISSSSNSAGGANSLSALTTGNGSNTGWGVSTLSFLQTGQLNSAFGFNAGLNYTSSESSNIVIGNTGTTGESNVIRIGTQGSGAGQQSQTYIAGVINTVSGRVVKITSPGAYPYTTLTTDYVILVDTSVARTIVPLAAPVTGTTYRIKDSVGSAAANNITITPSGKNIDGVASYVINNAYGSVDIVYNGTEWNKF